LINNRQNGRRRGRGGPRPQGNPGQPGGGNRIDNRARGNAQQLHEKYKNLARDAQMAGDRVTTEYYLQFADHYFRVLNENRARFEEQRPRQRDDADDDFDGDDEFEARDQREPRDYRDQREPREPRDQGGQRREREFRRDRDEDRRPRQPEAAEPQFEGEQAEQPQQADEGQRRPRRQRRPRNDFEAEGGEAQTLDAAILPPAIAVVANEGSEEAPAPRRRGRPRRTEAANDPVEIPPAA
jgi:hypothetical protein